MDSRTNAYPLANLEEEVNSSSAVLMTTDGSIVLNRETLVSDTTAFYFKVIVYSSMCACISLVGITTNIINIIVFVRQGINSDSGSVSLLGLAVSDLCCVITMLWLSISFGIFLADPPGLSWDPWEVSYITGGWPHLMFAQVTRMVTAYLAFERCVCVVFPFKVKSLFTPRRYFIIFVCIVICCGLCFFPVFLTEQLQFRKDPETNATRLVLVSAPNWREVIAVMYYINSIINQASVAIVFLCTMITVSRVKLSKAWRKSMATGSSSQPETEIPKSQPGKDTDKQNNVSKQEEKAQSSQMQKSKMQKEKKLVRMIISISVIFLSCYLPDLALLIANTINPEIRVNGKNDNLAMVFYAFTFLMETINSSINIIVYYTMSSKYKQEFRLLFRLKSS